MLSLLEKTITGSGTGYAAIDLINAFFSIRKEAQSIGDGQHYIVMILPAGYVDSPSLFHDIV